MFDLEKEGIYIPNTEAMRKYLEGLNYVVIPMDSRIYRSFQSYRSLCFDSRIEDFRYIQQADEIFYCMNAPTLTEDQAKFFFDILHVSADFQTFKEALQQYINKE